jgi:hypothetical protein
MSPVDLIWPFFTEWKSLSTYLPSHHHHYAIFELKQQDLILYETLCSNQTHTKKRLIGCVCVSQRRLSHARRKGGVNDDS